MIFQLTDAKNGEKTLSINGVSLYSNYTPKTAAKKFIESTINAEADGFILFGLGLGYHVEALIQKSSTKKIVAVYIRDEERKFFLQHVDKNILDKINLTPIEKLKFLQNFQIIIPMPWLKSMEGEGNIVELLEDIKIRQMSFERYRPIMEENFRLNIELNDDPWESFVTVNASKIACLVSAGPSLDSQYDLLKQFREKTFVLCAGAAWKPLYLNGIIPDAVVVTDADDIVARQFKDVGVSPPLLYLSTANHRVVSTYNGQRYIMFQEGFGEAEKIGFERKLSLVETGGSVATTMLSLLHIAGYKNVFLFGQDLGFIHNTHAAQSSSNVTTNSQKEMKKIKSNNGKEIFTNNSLLSFKRWIEQYVKKNRQNLTVWNLSENGARIEGCHFQNERRAIQLLNELI